MLTEELQVALDILQDNPSGEPMAWALEVLGAVVGQATYKLGPGGRLRKGVSQSTTGNKRMKFSRSGSDGGPCTASWVSAGTEGIDRRSSFSAAAPGPRGWSTSGGR